MIAETPNSHGAIPTKEMKGVANNYGGKKSTDRVSCTFYPNPITRIAYMPVWTVPHIHIILGYFLG